MNPDDAMLRLQYYKETGQADEAKNYEQYLRETGQFKESGHRPTKLELAKRDAATPHPEDMEDPDPSYAQQALGGIASLARDIPGAEAAQAGARSLFRGQPYGEALSDIRSAEDAAPKWVRRGNRIAGATIAGAAMPGKNLMLQGARYGVFSGLLKSDPNADVKDRLHSAAYEGAVDALAPKVAQGLGAAGRTLASKSLGETALARKAAMEAADRLGYGKAAAEGSLAAANPTPAAVSTALNEPDIKPYVTIIRKSRTLKGADDATILREAYKLMTERQQVLGKRVLNAADYKAGSELEQADIGAGKRELLRAADGIMPSLRPAVYAHAGASGEKQAFRQAADATKRIVQGVPVAGKNLEKKSPEAFMDQIGAMSPEEARGALQGVLGRLKEVGPVVNVNPFKLFGGPSTAMNFSKMLPYIEALDQKAGNNFSSVLGAAGIGSAGVLSH